MPRKAYAPHRETGRTHRTAVRASGFASVFLTAVAVLVTGCTGTGGAEDAAADAKTGTETAPVAQPGKYRSLLEPCGSLGRSTLEELLPGMAQLPEEQRKDLLRGTPVSTYDPDRRAGCGWKADSQDTAHTLSLDFERVVSYDPAVSDADRAREVFAKKQAAVSATAGDPGTETASSGETATDSTAPAASDDPAQSSGSPSGTPDDLAPRALDGIGDAAFLNDVVDSADTGSTARHRTVSVAFRTSNVIVTVVYAEHPGRLAEVPSSKELQDKAQNVARNLAEKISD
ncbi:DUF3558 domain-containing protein [Streptomyces sp. CAU 1734]|uniref:DUF3558 domain-containing protein n=1 Tax=Streptomyces sp. CAU 1734 TaxID=3140360 RepID=UPI00325FF182